MRLRRRQLEPFHYLTVQSGKASGPQFALVQYQVNPRKHDKEDTGTIISR